MFTYSSLSIHSAAPIDDIEQHLGEIGAARKACGTYALGGIEIEIVPRDPSAFGRFSIPCHEVSVRGDRMAAENFLTNFRLRFLSLGG
ncbi:MAG: hypothetical protein FWD98_05935 [Defluviitaleaceae bacterium]|nr:hypothetical protein [Defluviitaleaceae bacterium]